MWFKANQKGYRYGGNIRHGDTFCINKVAVREKELMYVIMDDLQECDNEDYSINNGKKLKDVLNLKELTPQVLHSLVEKITCKYRMMAVHIQYSFVNPLQET